MQDLDSAPKSSKTPQNPGLKFYRRLRALATRAVFAPLILLAVSPPSEAMQLGVNLVVNGDAETDDVSGWVQNTGIGTIASSGPGFLGLSQPAVIGDFSFHGGQGNVDQDMEQEIDVSSHANWIDAGLLTSQFSILIQSRRAGHVDDVGTATVQYLNGIGAIISQVSFQDPPSTTLDWQAFADARTVPPTTRSVLIVLETTRTKGISTESFFDNVVLSLGLASPGGPYCSGDGTGNQCPCSAFGNPGEGCANSSGMGGASLVGTGETSLSNDTLKFHVAGVPGSKPGLLLRGDNQVSLPIGDGLLCVTGSSQRSQVQVTAAGATTFVDFNGSGFGSLANVGSSTYFQFWYRDQANPCSGDGFNFSNGWAVQYLP